MMKVKTREKQNTLQKILKMRLNYYNNTKQQQPNKHKLTEI